MRDKPGNLAAPGFNHALHRLRDVGLVESPLVGITENQRRTVICTHQYIAVGCSTVENIKRINAGRLVRVRVNELHLRRGRFGLAHKLP